MNEFVIWIIIIIIGFIIYGTYLIIYKIVMINIIGLKDYKKYNKNKESKDLIFLNVMYEDQIKNSNPKKITLWWMWAICLLSILIWALSPDREWERRERMSNPILNIFIISTITYNIGKYVEKNSNKIDIP